MEWNRGNIIGQGSSATVSIATAAATGELFAVKSVELSLSSFLQREKGFLSQLSSPYIVQYRGDQITYENDTRIYNLFMEYMPRGTISDLIKKNGGSLDESTIRTFSHQILSGLDYLHGKGIVHCDIKGQNVLIGNHGLKIADLGCAKDVSATSAFSGTPAFMAPEVARGEEQGFPADVWAMGCTVIEMATGSHPFLNQENPVSVLYQVGFTGYTPEIPVNLSDEAKDFLIKCLEPDSEKRLTAKELLQHSFFNDLKLNSSIFEEFIRVTPTSVLEQGFWDSIEVPESGPNSVHVSYGPNFPAFRIGGLIRLSNSGFPNWDCEEDWISVRIRENEESMEIVQIESIVQLEEIFDSVDTVSDYYSDEVSIFHDSISELRETVMLCENIVSDVTNFVSLEVQENLMKILFIQFKCFRIFTILLVSFRNINFAALFLPHYNS